MLPDKGVLFAIGCILALGPARADDVIDSVMYREPDLPDAKVVKVFPARLKPLLLETLARPEVDSQCKAALTIARAHERGLTGLESTVPPLLEILSRPEQAPAVLLAAARALVVLDAKDCAGELFRLTRSGDDEFCQLVEPVLARWDYRPARPVWLERVREAKFEGGERTLMAIRLLGQVREESAAPRLRQLALDAGTPAPFRLEAAQALGTIQTSGLESAAKSAGSGISDRLVSAHLLRHHSGAETVAILQSLAKDGEPAVSTASVPRLFEIDPGLLLPLLPTVLANYDALTRSYGVEVLFRFPSQEHFQLLADLLDDPAPEVRVKSRRALHGLATSRPEYRSAIIDQGSRMLATESWRAQEQAAILLGQLDRKPAVSRLLKLLYSERPEVMVAAAWGLRKLAVADTLQPVLDFIVERYALLIGRGVPHISWDSIDPQLSQLVQFIGESKYKPADPALRKFIPPKLPPARENPPGPETRAAAFWALGLIHEGKADSTLVDSFKERLASSDIFQVRWMAAVSLGRMKARDALTTLREYSDVAKNRYLPISGSNASTWAIFQITGEPIPPPGIAEHLVGNWFLSPIK
jgi:HEAT repeat protein